LCDAFEASVLWGRAWIFPSCSLHGEIASSPITSQAFDNEHNKKTPDLPSSWISC